MSLKKANQFWIGMQNISKITKLINEKRKVDKKSYYLSRQDEMILSINFNKEQNLISLKEILKNKQVYELFGYVINDMYKFDFINSSSVDSTIQKSFYSTNDLDYLERINLLEHSFGVANEMNIIADISYGRVFDFYMLSALVHDFGKSPQLRSHYSLTSEKGHHKASAEYLERKKLELKDNLGKFELDMLNIVIAAIRVHHDNNSLISVPTEIENVFEDMKKNELQNLILEFLKKADNSQRKKELKKIRLGVL